MSDAELHQAIADHRAGRYPAAEAHYRAFLQAQPRHGGAHHNLGLLIAQRGVPEEALPHFAIACEAEPGRGQNWFSYAKAMLAAGRTDEARPLLEQARAHGMSGPAFETVLRQLPENPAADEEAETVAGLQAALARDPENGDLQLRLGDALAAEGDIKNAIAAYRQVLVSYPGLAEVHFRLGSLLSESGEIAEGFAYYMRRAELVRGGSPSAPAKEEPLHKTKHDREQRDYLAATDPSAGIFRIADGSRMEGPAVNPANATDELMRQWTGNTPQLVVIDNFLTPGALEKLRRYCAGSTIWHRVYDAGYIGATPEDGLACPLMAQIAEEISSTFPEILGTHRFRYLGAFKYDSELSTGTNTHADNAVVNVNFYIAPDEANLDPDSGGMDVWDAAAGSEAHMRRLNGDETAARAFLKERGAKLTRIPHRANRAVIFKSDLIHKTSDCRFAEGYLNKRINVSLLFGDRPLG